MAKRKCLRCQVDFDSTGTGNRICKKCDGRRGMHTTSIKTKSMIEFKKRMKEKMGLENWREKVLRDAKGIKKNIKGNRGSSDLGMP
jgi:hypothetical protein